MYQLTKIIQTIFSPHLALQHVKEAFPDKCSSPIFPQQFPRTNFRLDEDDDDDNDEDDVPCL